MERYELGTFIDTIGEAEVFLTEVAAIEDDLYAFGLRAAFDLPSSTKGLEAMDSFVGGFAGLQRMATVNDQSLASELRALESERNLVEQVSLVALRMKMAKARRSVRVSTALVSVAMIIPVFRRIAKSRSLFGNEPVLLDRIIIGLGQVRARAQLLYDLISRRTWGDNDVMKPSNVDKDRVVRLIDAAIDDLEAAGSLSVARRAQIAEILREARTEVLSAVPTWNKIVGALVIVAAITSGIADAPNAVRSVREAVEHILGTSVDRPAQPSLPAPFSSPALSAVV